MEKLIIWYFMRVSFMPIRNVSLFEFVARRGERGSVNINNFEDHKLICENRDCQIAYLVFFSKGGKIVLEISF